MKEIKRIVPIAIEPSVDEIADIIWSMDNEQQAFLLEQLAYKFSEVKMNGYMQMLAISESIKKRNTTGTVGGFIDDLHEYIGYEALTTDD
jgi:hypothetical protein